MEILHKLHKLDTWEFKKNLSVEEYAQLLVDASVVVGNSSSFIKECSFLGVTAVIVGSRQEGREMDENAWWVPMEYEPIVTGIAYARKRHFEPSNYFGDGTASTKIANILAEVEL
jgi:UDP-N-acetylglucosamine 2-epimerase